MKDYYGKIKSEMEQSGICESDIQMAIDVIKELQENAGSKIVSADKTKYSSDIGQHNIDLKLKK